MSGESQKLEFLQEISNAVSNVFNFDALLRIVIEKISKILKCSRCSIVLIDENGLPFIKLGKGISISGYIENEKIEKIGSITSQVINEKKSVSDSSRKFLSVPIINNSNVIGIINVTDRYGNDSFSPDDENVLSILATQIGYSIETIKFHKNIVKMEKISREMELASRFQKKIVKELESIEDVKIKSFYKTAFEVGGDFFEKYQIDENNHLLVCGDVSGKGLYASIIVVMIHSFIKSGIHSCRANFNISEFVKKLNNMLIQEIGNETTFATMFFLQINTKEKTLKYVNAGHNYPIYINNNRMDQLETGSIFLGSFDNIEFETGNLKYKSGDLMVIYSDGVVEYSDSITDHIKVKDKFCDIVYKNSDKDIHDIFKIILDEYYDFERKEVADDVSLMLLRF